MKRTGGQFGGVGGVAISKSNSTNEELERRKLELEVQVLRQQRRWEMWKSLTTVVIPVLTLLGLVGGGAKYFWDEGHKLRLRMEEVYSLSLKDLGSPSVFARVGAVTSLLSYVEMDRAYDERVVAVLVLEVADEPSVVVRETILGNLRKLKKRNPKLFENFLASVQRELGKVKQDLVLARADKERTRLEDERRTLERAEQTLLGLQE